MKIKVIGKAHREGVSKKTGRPYNFHQIFFNAPAPNVDGLSSQSVNLDGNLYGYDSIVIGSVYEFDFDQHGYVVAVNKVQ